MISRGRSLGVEVERHDGKLAGAIIRIAREIDARVDVIGAAHGKLFRLLHPTCHRPVDDDRTGEVEKPADA